MQFWKATLGSALFVLVAGSAVAQQCGETYAIQPGETLSEIADRVYGSVLRFDLIHEANIDVIGPDPARVEQGTPLFLPCARGERPPEPASSRIGIEEMAELFLDPQVQIIDLRENIGFGDQVVPGTLSAPFGDLVRAVNPTDGTPVEDAVRTKLGELGLFMDRPIVLVASDGAGRSSARLEWAEALLSAAGADTLYVLDGGFSAWKQQDMPLADGPVSPVPRRVNVDLAADWENRSARLRALEAEAR